MEIPAFWMTGGYIRQIVNNYGRISYNFGPTLLSWLEDKAPETYECILKSDRESQERFSGHGSAIAQAYNHVILPLANARDKTTQVSWGIRILNVALDAHRKACGCRKRRWMWKRWKRWPNTELNSRSWLRTRPDGCARWRTQLERRKWRHD